jgi:predicted transcriptional regulator
MNNTSSKKNNQKNNKKSEGMWAKIPKAVWIECTHSQLCVYGAVSMLKGGNEYTWASVDVIANHAGYSNSATDKAIRELIKLGWVGRIKQFGRPSKLFVYSDYISDSKIREDYLNGKKQASQEFAEKIRSKKKDNKLTNLQNLSENDKQNLSGSVLQNLNGNDLQNLSENIYKEQLQETITNNNVREESPILDTQPIGKTEQLPKDSAHTQEINLPKQFSKEEHELARILGFSIDDALQPEDPKQLAINTRQEEINNHYSNEIARVEQELNLQSDIMIPKLTIESLLEASESFLGRVGIGFDNNPRRILNLIYNQLPKDFVIKEDSKDVEILGDMIRKYMSSGKDERDSIAKRIYQAVEAMLKIYVIKKYGEPYREIVFPEITRANLVLYLNCNPTFKYCLGGFSNDIDGVYSEVCRLAAKDSKKKVSEIKIEHDKKLRQLQANRLADMQAMFSEEEKLQFQARTNAIINRMDSKPDISDEPLTKPIKANLTPEESLELNKLFLLKDPSKEDLDRLNYLLRKSKK